MSLLALAGTNSATGGYDIANSLKLERANSEAIAATNSTQSGNRKTWTFSTWIKRTEISYNGAFGVNALFYAASSGIRFESTDKLGIRLYTSGGLAGDFLTTQVFRDTSAWYHIVLTVDSTEATSSNRVKLWINGEQVTDFGTETYPNLNDEFQFGEAQSAAPIRIGNAYWGTSPFSAYIAETHYLNGTAKQASDFGEYDADSGIWIPKEYTDGGYGDIGFYYKYDNASSLGEDSSGEVHDASSLSNITSADQATDTPTNNFCTWNPLQTGWNTNYGTGQVIVEGATEAYASTNYAAIEGSMAVQSGKWYWESKPNRTGGIMVGVAALNGVRWAGDTAYWYLGMNAQGIGTILGNWYYNGTSTSTDATDWTNGDIVSIALDMDNYKIYMAVNGSWGGTSNPATGTGGYDFSSASNFTSNFVVPAGRIETANSSYVIETNFGGYTTMSIASGNSDSSGYGNFEYAPPSGYYALCTKNLEEYG